MLSISASLSMDSNYDAVIRSLLEDVNGALLLDHENKKEMDSMMTRWLEQLNSLQDKHGEDVSNIHVQAEKSMVKDYLVDQNGTSQKRIISVPSLASFEEMRTLVTKEKSAENPLKLIQAESRRDLNSVN